MNDEIEKKTENKQLESIRVNLLNSQLGSYDWDNLIKKQIEIDYAIQFLINQVLKSEIERNNKKR